MFHIINKSLLILIPIFCFIAFSSLSAYWVKAPYDAWRIYEILLLLTTNVLGLHLLYKKNYQIFDEKIRKIIFPLIALLATLVLISAFRAEYPLRAFADASLYFLLFSGCLIYAMLIKQEKKISENIAAIVALLPMFTLIFLPIAILDRLNGGIGVWTQSFTNIRMLDDALLPCLFLLWLRPGFLTPKETTSKRILFLTNGIIFIVSSIYILSFLFHGARACILGIIVGLFFAILINFKNKKVCLRLPFYSVLSAMTLFVLYHQFIPRNIGSALVRTDSSGRNVLWLKAWNGWLENPWFGVGGNHFFLQEPYALFMHPHNLFIKFLNEWGIAFFLFLILFSLLLFKLKQNIQKLPLFLIAGCIAVAINAMLSGNMVYPVSQITSIFLIAYTLQFILVETNEEKDSSKSVRYLWVVSIIIFSASLMLIHGQDIVCNNCISIDFEGAPGFWDSGRPLHLEPYIIENLGQHTNKY
ncbi:O-antigen ligase family protein [Acinetobacter towneri]|uniref:O-antigen ligase family protein n=1 Tax=Acinetobacter towneri TaxID=202956 RepID=UPI002578FDA6|nr:O-antigen ligase family protein [Acinetobacter towneri]MDM1486248.1 O-antigen ligase family protein [Acinetobacter towneri]